MEPADTYSLTHAKSFCTSSWARTRRSGGPSPSPAVQITGMPTGEESSSVSDTEADEMEEHLRGLGYLE